MAAPSETAAEQHSVLVSIIRIFSLIVVRIVGRPYPPVFCQFLFDRIGRPRNDALPVVEAFPDFDPAALLDAGDDLLRLDGLSGAEYPDEFLAVAGEDALYRERQAVAFAVGDDIDGGGHAGQVFHRIGHQFDPDPKVSNLIEAIVQIFRGIGDLGHQAPEFPSRIGVDAHLHAVAARNADHVAFAHVDHHFHPAEIGDPQQFRAGHLAGADHAFALFHVEPGHGAADGGVDDRFLQVLPGFFQARLAASDGIFRLAKPALRDVEFGSGVLEFGGRDSVEFEEFPVAFAILAGLPLLRPLARILGAEAAQRGGRLVDLRQVLVLTDLEQDRAGFHPVAFGDAEFHDFARYFRTDAHFHHGADGPGGRDGFHQILSPGTFHRDFYGRLAPEKKQAEQQPAAGRQEPFLAFGDFQRQIHNL